MASLVSSNELDESILCRGKSIDCAAFLSEELLSCFVDMLLTACVVI